MTKRTEDDEGAPAHEGQNRYDKIWRGMAELNDVAPEQIWGETAVADFMAMTGGEEADVRAMLDRVAWKVSEIWFRRGVPLQVNDLLRSATALEKAAKKAEGLLEKLEEARTAIDRMNSIHADLEFQDVEDPDADPIVLEDIDHLAMIKNELDVDRLKADLVLLLQKAQVSRDLKLPGGRAKDGSPARGVQPELALEVIQAWEKFGKVASANESKDRTTPNGPFMRFATALLSGLRRPGAPKLTQGAMSKSLKNALAKRAEKTSVD